MAERITYDERLLNGAAEYDDGTLGFDWGGLIGVGLQTGIGFLTKPKGPKPPHALSDSGEVAAALDGMYAEWNSALATVADKALLLQTAVALKQWLNDPAVFKQSGGENDAYLNNAKRDIDNSIAALQADAGATQTVVDPATGQMVTVAADDGQIIDGISNTTLLLAVAAIGGIFLMTRGN